MYREVSLLYMRNAFFVGGVLGGLLVLGILLANAFSTQDTRGFEKALQNNYGGGYEMVLSAFRDASLDACADGAFLRVKPVVFGVMLSWCDTEWFFGIDRVLFQLSGPRISYEDVQEYGAAPNDMDANAVLREMHRRFSEGQISQPRWEIIDGSGAERFTLARDFGEQTVYPEQVLADMMLGDIRYVIVGQKNVNTPRIDLPARAAIQFSGIIAQENDGPWKVLLDITNEYSASPSSSYIYFKPNVHELFFEDGELYVDILDSAGAGSGEGRLIRLRYDENGVAQNITWDVMGEMYYIPEVFTRAWSWEHLGDEGSAEKAFASVK